VTKSADNEIKRQVAFQLMMIQNHRYEPWDYPIFCFNLDKTEYQQPHFHITKGYNKLLANYLARRSGKDIPIVVINYGRLTSAIDIEKKILNYKDFCQWIGKDLDLDFSFIRWENQTYPVIENLFENKVKVTNLSIVDNWVAILQKYFFNSKISIVVSDLFDSRVYDTSGFFNILTVPTNLNLPSNIERTTHIREYKNIMINARQDLPCLLLTTNRKIKLDLFDIIWFLQDHASDYVSEDRSYSILGPGVFRADSVLPGSEL
jgi:hypothetical protein